MLSGCVRCGMCHPTVPYRRYQRCLVYRKIMHNSFLMDSDGVRCSEREVIRSKGTREQFWVSFHYHFVCHRCQQQCAVHIHRVNDVEACLFSHLGVVVSFVPRLSGLGSSVDILLQFCSPREQWEVKRLRRNFSIGVSIQCCRHYECSLASWLT